MSSTSLDSLSREHIFSLIKMQQDMADPAKAEGHRTITQMVSDMKPMILGGGGRHKKGECQN